MKKSIARNYIYNLIYQMLTILLPLVTTPYLSRVLGAEPIGIYGYTISIVTYFVLFGTLGISMYGQRETAYKGDNKAERSKVFWELIIIRTITLSISMLLFYMIYGRTGEYTIYYRILLIQLVANLFDISWLFQGIEEFEKTVVRNLVVKLLSLILIFTVIKTPNDLWKYFAIYVGAELLGNITLWFYLPQYIEKVSIKKLDLKKHIKPVISLFLPQIAIQIYTVLDKTMIGVITKDMVEVGYYEQAQKIIKLLMTIATSLGTVMMPRIAATYSKGNKEKVREYMNTSFSFIMLLAFPLMFGIISVANKFVPLFYGNGYEKVIPIMCIISPIIIFIGLSNVTGTQYLLPTKQQNKYTISVVMGAVVNFILNIILIKKYASIGASIATVVAEFCVTLSQFILIRKNIKFKEVIPIIYKYIIASIVMFIASMVVGCCITNNILSIFIQILVSVIIYLGVLIIMKDKMIDEGINIVKKKIKVK